MVAGEAGAGLPVLRHGFADAAAAAAEGAVKELDLATALRDIPESERGWQTETRSVKCQSCQAISVFKPERVAQNCDFCGSPALVPYEEIKAPIRPESVLPFKLEQSRGARQSSRMVSQPLVRAEPVQDAAPSPTPLHGLYLPYWTFDAQVAAQWTAEAGYYYYTTESYTDSKGSADPPGAA